MYQCNYCKRYLKEKYNNCPGCGSDSFKKVASFTEQIIKTPPEGGYKVQLNNFKFQKKGFIIPIVVILYIIFIVFIFDPMFISTGINMRDNDDKIFEIMFIIFGILALSVPIKIIYVIFKELNKENKNINKDINKVKKLSKQGILIKNLPYELKLDKNIVSGKPIYRIKVLYEIEKGRTLSLLSEPKYITTLGREDGTVDLLIDPDDYSNYFIDFEIY